jgi:hypothetical protein
LSEAPGSNLSLLDVYYIMQMCPFDTALRTGFSNPTDATFGNVKQSPFCQLFTGDEWAMFEYAGDLGLYYDYGYGNSNGPAEGSGYVQELLSRLTSKATDSVGVSSSFPLNKPFYIDFTHDDEMIAIFSALQLFPDARDTPLSLTTPDASRSFFTSKLVPFAAKMVVEKMECDSDIFGNQKEYIRLLINDQVQTLDFCDSDEDGLCELSAFVNALQG